MGIPGLLAALFLPWLLGLVWLRVRWLGAGNVAWPALLGYAYLVGTLATTLVMRLLDVLGLRLGFSSIALSLVLLIVLGLMVGRGAIWRGLHVGADFRSVSGWGGVVFVVLLELVVIRMAGLGLEVIWQPLFPWDAWSQWATKARVWYELGHLTPFISAEAWLQGVEGYTDLAPHYPPAIPLLQAWMSFGLGRWDDALMNLPWLMVALALAMAFYGQARIWGVSPLFAMMATYFLLSLPMLNTHVALAGYADLFLGAAYGMAAFAFFNWSRSRDRWQGTMAVLLGAGCILIKQPGIGWALTFLPALWVALAPRAGLIGSVVLGGLGLACLLIFGQAGIGLLGYSVKFAFTAVWEPLWVNLAILDNWHLLFYLAVMALLLFLPRLFSPAFRAMSMLLASALAFIFVVFFFTHVSTWIESYTVVNRALLHMVPMLLFYVMVLFWEAGGESGKSDQTANAVFIGREESN